MVGAGRARDHGIVIGSGIPGPHNAITDPAPNNHLLSSCRVA